MRRGNEAIRWGWETVIRKETVEKLVNDLFDAAEDMIAQTWPKTPDPEPVIFELAPNMLWPAVSENWVQWTNYYKNKSTGEILPFHAGSFDWKDPEEVLESIKKLREATKWCLEQAENRRKTAREIMEKQASAIEEIRQVEAAIKLGE
ncbi:MAG: hypothetical protein QW570_08460 [Candidatus Caldarchaeum sp.]